MYIVSSSSSSSLDVFIYTSKKEWRRRRRREKSPAAGQIEARASRSPAAAQPLSVRFSFLSGVYYMYIVCMAWKSSSSSIFRFPSRKTHERKLGFSLSILENDFLVGFRMDAQSYTPLQSNLWDISSQQLAHVYREELLSNSIKTRNNKEPTAEREKKSKMSQRNSVKNFGGRRRGGGFSNFIFRPSLSHFLIFLCSFILFFWLPFFLILSLEEVASSYPRWRGPDHSHLAGICHYLTEEKI